MTLGCDRFAMRHVDDQSEKELASRLGIGETLLGKFMADLHRLPDC